jgi:hypothetical protein
MQALRDACPRGGSDITIFRAIEFAHPLARSSAQLPSTTTCLEDEPVQTERHYLELSVIATSMLPAAAKCRGATQANIVDGAFVASSQRKWARRKIG